MGFKIYNSFKYKKVAIPETARTTIFLLSSLPVCFFSPLVSVRLFFFPSLYSFPKHLHWKHIFSAGFCDFEKDLCTWKNIKSDQFDWLRGKGYTDTPNTGPTTDHTLKTPEGHYAYIETSDPQAPGDIARLQSEDFLPSNMSVCLRFWCQMNGEHVDTLNVFVRNINDKRESYVWSQKGDNGPEWFYAQLNVDRFYTNKPYHVSVFIDLLYSVFP